MTALQTHQNFFNALYAPHEVVALMFSSGTGKVQHAFVPVSTVITENYFNTLKGLNETQNIYVSMNPFRPELVGQKDGRTKANVASVKRIYVDADTDGPQAVNRILTSGKVPPSTVTLESSPGKFQMIWNVSGLTQDTAESLMKAMAEEFQTDPAVAEIARVLRVPGFRNWKYIDAPEVKAISINPSATYSQSAFQVAVRTAEKFEPKAEGWINEPIIHGNINNRLTKIAGYYIQEKFVKDADVLYLLLEGHAVRQAVHADGVTPFTCNLDEIRKVADGCISRYKTNKLELNQQPTAQPGAPVEITPELLLKEFPAYDGTEPDELPMLIEGFMPKGVGFFGSLSGTGKTWCGLSVAKALSSGTPLWGVFPVKRKTAILYLVPEASDASFKRRLMKMRITQDKNLFRYRTITQGITRPLSDPITVAMIQQLSATHDVLVIVDTAVRFFRGGDENAAKENNLVQDSDMLRSLGANVLFLHHSPKATKEAAELTLENALRGTGDFGAMADFVYAFRRDEKTFSQGEGPEEIEVVCVKPRDFEPPLPFRLQLKRKAKNGEPGPVVSVIDEKGDLAYIGNAAVKDDHSKMLAAIFYENPLISFNDLVIMLKMKRELVRVFCKRNGGWKQVEEVFAGSKGRAGKRKRWTQGLVMAGQVEQMNSAPDNVAPGVSGNTVTLEDVRMGF